MNIFCVYGSAKLKLKRIQNNVILYLTSLFDLEYRHELF